MRFLWSCKVRTHFACWVPGCSQIILLKFLSTFCSWTCIGSVRPAHVASGESYFWTFYCQQLRVSVIDLRDALETLAESLLCRERGDPLIRCRESFHCISNRGLLCPFCMLEHICLTVLADHVLCSSWLITSCWNNCDSSSHGPAQCALNLSPWNSWVK